MNRKKSVVVIGGGTGTYTLLRGLRQYHETIDIKAVVTMADDGGSTGRLRDEFGYLPVGDARQALVALAPDLDADHDIMRELFLYRFQKGGAGLAGHNVGNLLLTALTDMLGSEVRAIEAASRILRVAGEVVPVTTHNVRLQATYASGREVVGEHAIDEPPVEYHHDRIVALRLANDAHIYERAATILAEADMVVLGPGDLYTSVLANCVVPGVAEVLATKTTPLVFVANLMARSGQTIGMHLPEYVAEIERYLGRAPSHVVVPDAPLPADLLARYSAMEGVHDVRHVLPTTSSVCCLARPIVSDEAYVAKAGDVLKRSLIRHDGAALAQVVADLLHSTAASRD